jgi:hypothetical protein
MAVQLLGTASMSQQAQVCFLFPSLPSCPSSNPPTSQNCDGTKTVLILAGEFLKKAEHLLIMGLHPREIRQGYELAGRKALQELESTFFDSFYLNPLPLFLFLLPSFFPLSSSANT